MKQVRVVWVSVANGKVELVFSRSGPNHCVTVSGPGRGRGQECGIGLSFSSSPFVHGIDVVGSDEIMHGFADAQVSRLEVVLSDGRTQVVPVVDDTFVVVLTPAQQHGQLIAYSSDGTAIGTATIAPPFFPL